MTRTAGVFRSPRLIALAEIVAAALLVTAHWSFFVEHRLFDQLLNFGENYAFVLNAGEARYFLVTVLTGLPVTLLLVDASLRVWAPSRSTLFQRISSGPRLSAAIFALLGAVLAEGCARLFSHMQFTDDERIYLWEAQNLLHGSFSAARPEPSEFFHRFFHFMLRLPDGRWGSIYPPGQPALIALGMLLHAPHLPQLVLVGLTVWTASRLADDLWGSEAAVLTAALVATSPLVVLIGATLHNAVPAMFFGLTALRCAFLYRASGRRRDLVYAACAAGAALTCRPFDAVLLTAPAALLIASRLVRRGDAGAWKGRALDVCWGTLAIAPFVVFLLLWQRATTGSALLAPYTVFMRRWPGSHAFGFGLSAFGVDHTLELAFSKALVVWARFDTWLFGWPLATLPLMLVLLGLKRDEAACWLLAALGLHSVGYFFYAAPSVQTFGTYYQLPLVPLVAVLTARAVLGLRDALRALGEAASAVPMRALAALSVVAGCLFWLPQLAYLWRVADRIAAPFRVAEAAAKEGPILVFHRAMQPSKEPRFTRWVFWPPLAKSDLSDHV
ncbi:MAG TPA: glycosyltransferase family 39 protein, partial [Polyangiaceae bacterium]